MHPWEAWRPLKCMFLASPDALEDDNEDEDDDKDEDDKNITKMIKMKKTIKVKKMTKMKKVKKLKQDDEDNESYLIKVIKVREVRIVKGVTAGDVLPEVMFFYGFSYLNFSGQVSPSSAEMEKRMTWKCGGRQNYTFASSLINKFMQRRPPW